MSKHNKQGLVIAILYCCIQALYDYKPIYMPTTKIIYVMEPFLVKPRAHNDSRLIKNEDEVSQCIENLCNPYTATDAEVKW